MVRNYTIEWHPFWRNARREHLWAAFLSKLYLINKDLGLESFEECEDFTRLLIIESKRVLDVFRKTCSESQHEKIFYGCQLVWQLRTTKELLDALDGVSSVAANVPYSQIGEFFLRSEKLPHINQLRFLIEGRGLWFTD